MVNSILYRFCCGCKSDLCLAIVQDLRLENRKIIMSRCANLQVVTIPVRSPMLFKSREWDDIDDWFVHDEITGTLHSSEELIDVLHLAATLECLTAVLPNMNKIILRNIWSQHASAEMIAYPDVLGVKPKGKSIRAVTTKDIDGLIRDMKRWAVEELAKLNRDDVLVTVEYEVEDCKMLDVNDKDWDEDTDEDQLVLTD